MMEAETASAVLPAFPENFCILALGGNIGDTDALFRRAVQMLGQGGFRVEKLSSFHRTDPEGCEAGAGTFLNAALSGYWEDSPLALLDLCQSIEAANGRPLLHPHWHSRTLDIDLILFGREKMKTPRLTLPHPLAGRRSFVLLPLREICPAAAEYLKRIADEEDRLGKSFL